MIALAAFVVLVQPDSVSAYNLLDTITPDPAIGGSIRDVLVDTKHHRLFTAESNTNRVLVYNLTDTNKLPDKTPDNVIGQPDFSSKAAHTNRNGLYCWRSCGLGYDSDRNLLFVADDGNSRVLVFDLASGISNGMDAAYVIGQVDFTSAVMARTVNGFANMNGKVVYDGTTQRLFVSDANKNSRVLVFDVSKLTNYPTATHVLGQPDFTGKVNGEPTFTWEYWEGVTNNATRMSTGGLALDTASQRLFVSDQGNNYVMVFNVAPGVIKNTNAPAYSIGYRNVYTWQLLYHVLHWTVSRNSANTDKNNAVAAAGLGFDQDRRMLYVQRDLGVGIFDVAEISNGEDAVGHHGGTNRESVGMGFDPINRWLYVPFNDGSVYIYEYMHVATLSLPSAYIKQPYSQKISVAGGQGNVDIAGIVSGALPPGLKIDSAGDISGTPTQLGGYSFDYRVTDDNGDNGAFADTKTFTINVVEPQAQGSVLGSVAKAGGAAVVAPDEKPTGAQSQIGQAKPSPIGPNVGDSLVLSNMPSHQAQIAAAIGITAAIVAATMLIIHRMRVGAKG